jgi:hypothetical protein
MTPKNGIMTKKKKNDNLNQVKLFICLTLLENPVRVPNFFFAWQGPYKVTARLSKLNCRVVNQKGKKSVVHLNRIKRAFKQGIWKNWERYNRKQRGRQPERKEDEQVEIAHRPVTIPVALEGNRQQVPGTPNRSPPRDLDTPSTAPQF